VELKLASNIVVIFTSDKGGIIGRRHITSDEPPPEEKTTLYEGGIRVLLIVRWPGIHPVRPRMRGYRRTAQPVSLFSG